MCSRRVTLLVLTAGDEPEHGIVLNDVVSLLKKTRRVVIAGLLAAGFFALEGCYYLQAVNGHFGVMNQRRPVAEVIADEESSDELRERLAMVLEARDFAISELELPDNDSYRTYADLGRDYVVWNIMAAPEFSLAAKRWCYPVAGCVAYRGYFNEASARKFKDKLTAQGYDVAMGGVSAYSTLGRFADPLLNTMMHWADIDLVTTMFHELAHQKLYIKGDTAFNESYATAVASFGIKRWLAQRDELALLDDYQQRLELRRSMMGLIAQTRVSLRRLYTEDLPDTIKRERKSDLLGELSRQAQELTDASDSAARNWLAAPLNNARLVSASLYEGQRVAFARILENCSANLACFYGETEKLAAMTSEDRQRALQRLLKSG